MPPPDHARVLQIARPEDAVEDTTVVHPRNATRLVRQHRLDAAPFMIGEFVAHDSSPSLGAFPRREGPSWRRFDGSGHFRYAIYRCNSLRTLVLQRVGHSLCSERTGRSRTATCRKRNSKAAKAGKSRRHTALPRRWSWPLLRQTSRMRKLISTEHSLLQDNRWPNPSN
jgi:hypothetical protein